MTLSKFLLTVLFSLFCAVQASAQSTEGSPIVSVLETLQDESAGNQIIPIRTESPYRTLQSLFLLRDDFEVSMAEYQQSQDTKNAIRVFRVMEQLRSLIDLSNLSLADEREVGSETVLYLLDILGRIKSIDIDSVPGANEQDLRNFSGYRLPGTPIRIIRMDKGDRAGEYLFSASTVKAAPRFFDAVKWLPLRSTVGKSTLGISSWTEVGQQLTGPWIPISLIDGLPNTLKRAVLDTPIWKILLVILLCLVSGVVLRAWHILLTQRITKDPVNSIRLKIISPIGIMLAALWLHNVFLFQINTAGRFFELSTFCLSLVFFGSAASAFWLICKAFFETVLLDARRIQSDLDDSFIQLVGQIVGVIGSVLILGYGAQELGAPIVSVIAGFGIGGVAVALAVRPTLENLIGGFILFLDRPVRVGDYCTFGDKTATVESIGMRSTQLRALDRTLISIPNAQFVDMQIINWAKCDAMLIHQTLGLRFETDTEQLRHVLTKIREMLHSHPRIETDTIRVRFSGFGASSVDVELRIYAKTREWNDFYAIKEDVLLRVAEIVKASGSDFAFPSQTVYMSKDTGLDADRTEQAHQEVATWRSQRELPFPLFSSKRLAALAGRIKYPPRGSPDYLASEQELAEGGETLSAEAPQEKIS